MDGKQRVSEEKTQKMVTEEDEYKTNHPRVERDSPRPDWLAPR